MAAVPAAARDRPRAHRIRRVASRLWCSLVALGLLVGTGYGDVFFALMRAAGLA